MQKILKPIKVAWIVLLISSFCLLLAQDNDKKKEVSSQEQRDSSVDKLVNTVDSIRVSNEDFKRVLDSINNARK